MSTGRRSARSRARIMIVDDDLGLASGLKDAFERQGDQVLVVDRGSKALEAASRFHPDVVLLDVMMPVVDGWQTLDQIRANAATATTPVIMLTAADTEAAKVRGFSLGADDYVTKPFSLLELRCRVEAVLRRTSPEPSGQEAESIPVIGEGSCLEFVSADEVYFIDGMRNYTNVHTFDTRRLCRMTLGEIDERGIDGFMRVQRSFIVNLGHVRGCGWVTKSTYELKLADLAETTIPVSRALIAEVQRSLGVRR